ncbi:DotU family type IV/VI secretion system protein [Paraherbaspirillum soli]|uniref:DotU family type IV/VI secretion system protein n=1 Tax=Paraherbaspirillum soli TaxID=631222 RepID=A0ABW0M680_9BURK
MTSHSTRSLRALLRDTALQIALLPQQPGIPAMPIWRTRCGILIAQLRLAMREADYDETLIAEAAYAQCALLDEAALRHLPDDQRREWQRESLEMHFFSSDEAADAIYQRLESLLRQPAPSAERLALYDLVLGLGFGGRYPDQDDAGRQRLVAGLVRAMQSGEPTPALPTRPGVQRRRLPARAIALLGWSALGIGVSLMLWLTLERQLGHSTQRLFQLQTVAAGMTQEK